MIVIFVFECAITSCLHSHVWNQVILSVGEEVMSSEVIYTINYTYCPIDLTNGEYRLNITTINGAGTEVTLQCNNKRLQLLKVT